MNSRLIKILVEFKSLFLSIIILIGTQIFGRSKGVLLGNAEWAEYSKKQYASESQSWGSDGDGHIVIPIFFIALLLIASIPWAIVGKFIWKKKLYYMIPDLLFALISGFGLVFYFIFMVENSVYRTIVEDKNIGLIVIVASMFVGILFNTTEIFYRVSKSDWNTVLKMWGWTVTVFSLFYFSVASIIVWQLEKYNMYVLIVFPAISLILFGSLIVLSMNIYKTIRIKNAG